MELLNLYPVPPRAAIEQFRPLPVDRSCRRCPASQGSKSVCIPADGEPGGVLLVGLYPGREEDLEDRVNVGKSGGYLRLLVSRFYKGPVAFDNALRCHGATRLDDEVVTDAVQKCAPYLTQTIAECKPERIVALGDLAMQAVLGRKLPPLSVRRGYGWLRGWTDDLGHVITDKPVPVFEVIHPAAAGRNRFIRQRFEADLKWALTCPIPKQPPWYGMVRVVQTPEEAEEAVAVLRHQKWVSVDAEWAGLFFEPDFSLLCVGCSGKGSENAYQWDEAALANPAVRAPLAKLLGDPTFPKVGHNLKSDMHALWSAHQIEVRGLKHDTMLVRAMLESESLKRLEVVAETCGMGGHKDEVIQAVEEAAGIIQKARNRAKAEGLMRAKLLSLFPVIENKWIEAAIRCGAEPGRFAYGLVPRAKLLPYNGRDAISSSGAAEVQEEQLALPENQDVRRAWETIARPAVWASMHVERWGIAVSLESLRQFEQFVTTKRAEIQKRLDRYGQGFNAASSKQVGALLFEKLHLSVQEYTPSGKPSTDAKDLEHLKGKHPAVDDILDYRKVDKLLGTYARGLQEHVRSDGRIHFSINLDGARTGRTSTDDPNLQNIPSEKKDPIYGRIARDCFVASPGCVLLSADYSQLELRVAAMLSGDEAMIDFFRRGVDIHLGAAKLISRRAWGIPPEAVTSEHRAKVKPIVFGLLYGKGKYTLAAELGCSPEEAEGITTAIFGAFPKLKLWTAQCLAETQRTGYSWTWWDGQRARRRDMYRIADPEDEVRNRAEHGSWNGPCQGTASDFLLMSMTEVVKWILENGIPAKVVAPIHDQLLMDVEEEAVEEVAVKTNEIMSGWNSLGVPLVVDFEKGKSWGSLTKYALPKAA